MTAADLIGMLLALLFLSASTFTGWHLFRVWLRTRRRPEALMMAGLVGVGPLGFGPSLLAEAMQASDPATAATLRCAGLFGASIGVVAFAAFTQVVFRPGSGWGRATVLLSALALAALMGQTLLDHWTGDPDRSDPALLVRGILFSLVWGWMGVECLRYRSRMKRRLAIGLADPLVVNRFTLWALVSIGSVVINTVGTVLGVRAGQNALDDTLLLAVTGGIGMIDTVGIYLAFLPPRAYAAWIRRNAAMPGSTLSGPTRGDAS